MYMAVNMNRIVRLTNVSAKEFHEFYSNISVSCRRLSRDQMLDIADLLHDMISEQRGHGYAGPLGAAYVGSRDAAR